MEFSHTPPVVVERRRRREHSRPRGKGSPFLRDPQFLATLTPGPAARQPTSGAHPIGGIRTSTPPPTRCCYCLPQPHSYSPPRKTPSPARHGTLRTGTASRRYPQTYFPACPTRQSQRYERSPPTRLRRFIRVRRYILFFWQVPQCSLSPRMAQVLEDWDRLGIHFFCPCRAETP